MNKVCCILSGLHAHLSGINTGKSGRSGGAGSNTLAIRGGFDGPLTAPWRKTVSIFKQPVTLVHTTSRETKPAPSSELQAAARAGTGRRDKPKQVFWPKRLEGLRPMMPVRTEDIPKRKSRKSDEPKKIDAGMENGNDDEAHLQYENGLEAPGIPEALALPHRIQPVGPDVTDEVAAASLASALQTPPLTSGSQHHQPPITGQTNPKKHLDSNPGVYTNPDQPLIHVSPCLILGEKIEIFLYFIFIFLYFYRPW